MAESLNWPIVIGGVYFTRLHPKTISRKVTEIGDGKVYFELWHSDETAPWGYDHLYEDGFRRLTLPENHAPIVAMTALLQRLADLRHSSPETPFVLAQNVLDLALEAEQLLAGQVVAK